MRKPFRWHSPTFSTSQVLPLHAANNHPYGAPDPTLADDELPYDDEPAEACAEDGDEACAEGRVG